MIFFLSQGPSNKRNLGLNEKGLGPILWSEYLRPLGGAKETGHSVAPLWGHLPAGWTAVITL